MAKKEHTFESILHELKAKEYQPIYYFMGDEPYYSDLLTDYLAENILLEEEKAFNQVVLYGTDTDIGTIINAAKAYPMMADYQVVIVKEAQALKKIEELSFYLQKPAPKTILIFNHRLGTLDRRKKISVDIEKAGVLFESKKLKESALPGFINSYLKARKVDIEPKAAELISESVGTDLSRLVGELAKLIITLPAGQNRITPALVEKNIGISKDFNNFELLRAVIDKQTFKANQIVKHFEENPKANPLIMSLSTLFNYFSNLMLAYYAPTKSEEGVAAQLGLRSSWLAKDYMLGMKRFSGMKVLQIIRQIRICDAQLKGVDNVTTKENELLKELIFFIMH